MKYKILLNYVKFQHFYCLFLGSVILYNLSLVFTDAHRFVLIRHKNMIILSNKS